MPLLYHATRLRENAEAIMRDGFKSRSGWPYGEGNCFSNRPLHGIFGPYVIEVDIDLHEEVLFYHYERINDAFCFREFFIPTEISNRSPRRLLACEANQILDGGQYWNWYPPGEPMGIFAKIHNMPPEDVDLWNPGQMSVYLRGQGLPCPCGQVCPPDLDVTTRHVYPKISEGANQ